MNIHGRGNDGAESDVQLHYRSLVVGITFRLVVLANHGLIMYKSIADYYNTNSNENEISLSRIGMPYKASKSNLKYTIIGLWIAGLSLLVAIVVPIVQFFLQKN